MRWQKLLLIIVFLGMCSWTLAEDTLMLKVVLPTKVHADKVIQDSIQIARGNSGNLENGSLDGNSIAVSGVKPGETITITASYTDDGDVTKQMSINLTVPSPGPLASLLGGSIAQSELSYDKAVDWKLDLTLENSPSGFQARF